MQSKRLTLPSALSPRSRLWLAVAAVLVLLFGAYYVRLWPRVNNNDLAVYIKAANALAHGGDIYADAEPFKALLESGKFDFNAPDTVWPFAYPPFAALIFLPFTILPYPAVAAICAVGNILALLLAGWLVLRGLGPLEPFDYVLLGAALLAYYPAVACVRLGQVEILELLLMAGAFWALKRGRDDLAGVLLGVATALKFYPGVLLAVLAWKKQWRPALVGLATAAVLLLAPFALIGFNQIPRYLSFMSLYSSGPFGAYPFNQSLHGFFARNLTANVFTPSLKGWDKPGLATALYLGCAGLLVLAWAWLTGGWLQGKGPGNDSTRGRRFDIEFTGSLAILLLVAPHSQVYAFVWLLLPFLALAYHLRRTGPAWGWLPLVVAYALVGRRYELYKPGLTRFVTSHIMFGALVLAALLLALLWRERRGKARCP